MFKHLYKKKRPRYLAILSLIIATSSYFACGVPQAEYDDVSEKLLEREQAIQGLEAQILEITIVLDEARADLDHSRKTGQSIETRVTELQGDINELTLSHKSQTSKLEFSHLTDLLEREHHISKLNADIHSSIILDIKQKKEIENAQNRYNILKYENENLDQSQTELRKQIDSLNNKVALLDNEVDSLNNVVDSLNNELEENSAESIQNQIIALKLERDQWIEKVMAMQALTSPYMKDSRIHTSAGRLLCTGSMLPELHCGDLVLTKSNLSHHEIDVGDIIVFHPRDCSTGLTNTKSQTMHRVVEIDHGWFVTKGDNNYHRDGCRIPIGNIKGKVLGWVDNLYPEDVIETRNYQTIKNRLNEKTENYENKRGQYENKLLLQKQAEIDFQNGLMASFTLDKLIKEIEKDLSKLRILGDEIMILNNYFFVMQDQIMNGSYVDNEWDYITQ